MQKGWFHDMNQSQMLGEQIGRVLRTHGIQKVRIRPAKGAVGRENPVVIRRAYDIRTSCGRQNTDSAESPLLLHIRGEKTTPLLRCIAIGAAVVGGMAAAAVIGRLCGEWKLRRKYAKLYAERLQRQRMRMEQRMQKQVRHVGGQQAGTV